MAELAAAGFSEDAFVLFRQLAENNEKAWFEANRETYERAIRTPFAALLESGAERYGGTVKLSRPHRDIRFSKNKMPYRTNLFGVIRGRNGDGAKVPSAAGLYASLSAEGIYAGSGYYDMSADQLARYRAALDEPTPAAALARAVAAAKKTLTQRGRGLKTAPKGFARDHPHIELLRLKDLIFGRQIAPASCGEGVPEQVFAAWESAMPVLDWLDRHVGASELPARERAGKRRSSRASG